MIQVGCTILSDISTSFGRRLIKTKGEANLLIEEVYHRTPPPRYNKDKENPNQRLNQRRNLKNKNRNRKELVEIVQELSLAVDYTLKQEQKEIRNLLEVILHFHRKLLKLSKRKHRSYRYHQHQTNNSHINQNLKKINQTKQQHFEEMESLKINSININGLNSPNKRRKFFIN